MARVKWAALASVVVMCASCSGGHSSPKAAGKTARGESTKCAEESTTPAKRGWVRSNLRPVSQPLVAACNFVFYDAHRGSLRVLALDAQTGRTAWAADASASSVTPGVMPALLAVGGVVVFFRSVGADQTAELVGVDARDGLTTWSSDSFEFTGWPAPCPDDPAVICVGGTIGPQTQVMRFAAATGKPLKSPVVATETVGRDLGPNLFDSGARDPDELVAVSRGSVAWKQPLASVFNEPGLSSDNGWNFDRVPTAGLFVGSVGGPALSQTNTSAVIDLGRSMTAGFRIADGAAVWREPGTQYVCSTLPCSGSALPSRTGAYRPPLFGLRIRGTGTASGGVGMSPSLSPDAKIVLEGFDLRSGRTRWSFDAGRNLTLVTGAMAPQVSATRVVLPDASGASMSLDLATGARAPLAPGTRLWCRASTTYKVKVPYHASNGRTIDTYRGGDALFACDARGHAQAKPSRVPRFVGPSIDGLASWSEKSKVVAAPTAG